MKNKINLGLISWFNKEKGYGVIEAIDIFDEFPKNDYANGNRSNSSVFLHINNWIDEAQVPLSIEVPIIFETAYLHNKISAINCKIFTAEKDHLQFLFSHLAQNEVLNINMNGINRKINIVETCLHFLKDDFNDEILFESLNECFSRTNNHLVNNKIETLLKVYLETNNLKLKTVINKIIQMNLNRFSPEIKIKLWKSNLCSLDNISEQDLLKISDKISYEDLKLINEINENVVNLIILQKTKNFEEKFNYESFMSFNRYIEIIKDDVLKKEICKTLNKIAESKLINDYYDITKNAIKKFSCTNSIEYFDDQFNNIPLFLNQTLKDKIKKIIVDCFKKEAKLDILLKVSLKRYIYQPEEILLERIDELDKTTVSEILNNAQLFSINFFYKILEYLSKFTEKHELVYNILEKLNNKEIYEEFDNIIYKMVNEDKHFEYWSAGKCKIVPENYLLNYFDNEEEKYSIIEDWIKSGYITIEKISFILKKKLDLINILQGRKAFYNILNILKFFTNYNSSIIKDLVKKNNKTYLLILWFLDFYKNFKLDLIKDNFILFKPKDQVIIIKKIFSLKHKGILDFSIFELYNIIFNEQNNFSTNELFNSEIKIDISTKIVLSGLKKLAESGEILVKNELFDLLFEELKPKNRESLTISYYFNICLGRYKYTLKRPNEYEKIIMYKNKYDIETDENDIEYDNKSIFVISFPYDEYLVKEIKKIPYRKYIPAIKVWTVPLEFKDEVFNFGINNGFYFNFDSKNKYEINKHLLEFKEYEFINQFSESAKAKIKDKITGLDFWWCLNKPCFNNCKSQHSFDQWQDYTMLDFIKILGLDADEKKSDGNIENGKYNKFVSQINKINDLLEHMYCEKCGNILYPIKTSNFAFYNVVRFCCINQKCEEYKKEIYLNHCFNYKCNAIIDSRKSAKCPNGLYICSKCYCCCSTKKFEERLDNLKKTGGYIPENLILHVSNNEGHLEKGEIYCYKCGSIMLKVNNDDDVIIKDRIYEKKKNKENREIYKYICTKCNNSYIPKKY